jgi:methionyl-tRNA formyltransferase
MTAVSILRFLRQKGERIVALVLHPTERSKHRDELCSLVSNDCLILEASDLQDPGTLSRISALQPQIGVSVFFGYILRRSFLDLFPLGCINVHPSLLPFNRGSSPNVWSIIEDTSPGATIHFVDEGIDTGDIIAQLEVSASFTDTGAILYGKLEMACLELFQATWPSIATGAFTRKAQRPSVGTIHRLGDIAALDEIILDRVYTARHLINIVRARTFAPYRGAYVTVGGRKIYLRLELLEEDELARDGGDE